MEDVPGDRPAQGPDIGPNTGAVIGHSVNHSVNHGASHSDNAVDSDNGTVHGVSHDVDRGVIRGVIHSVSGSVGVGDRTDHDTGPGAVHEVDRGVGHGAGHGAGLVLTVVFAVVLSVGLLGEMAGPRRVAGTALADPAATAGGHGPAAARSAAPRAVFTLGDNPLLGEEVVATTTDCGLPSFARSDERLTAYYQALVRCLNDVWGSVLRAANVPFRAPVLRVTADLPDSACGRAPNDETVAYYCGRDETIYMSTRRGLADGGGMQAPSHLATLSHEYGHHVQLLSGMLTTASRQIEDAGERTPSGLELTRRVELQANCFAGVFLFAVSGRGSISRSLGRQANQDFHHAVVEPAAQNTHGSPSHQGQWADSGFGSGHPSSCNTWNAPPDEVS
jgi:uncharacterized protein